MRTGRNLDKAIIQAIDDCLEAGMMVDFLAEHGSEAVNMLYTEFNMEDALEVRFEEGMEKGIEKGIVQGEKKKLKELVEKKVAKGKSIETIAHELEETIEVIQQLLEQR